MSALSFAGEKLEGRSFAGENLADTDFTGAELIDCCFDGADLTDCTFDKALCKNVSFRNIRSVHSSWVQAVLHDVSFDCAQLDRSFFAETEMSGISWKKVSLSKATMRGLPCMPDFADSDISMMHCLRCDLSGSTFFRVNAAMMILQECVGTGVVMTDSDASQMVAMHADLSDSKFLRCAMSLAAFTDSEVSRCDFSGSDLTGAHFSGAHIHHGIFSGVQLQKADFIAADMSGSDFSDADLTMADFSHATVQYAKYDRAEMQLLNGHNVDFSHAVITGTQLKKIRPTDAALLKAELFGNGYIH